MLIARGNGAAFDILVRRYQKRVLAVAGRLLGQRVALAGDDRPKPRGHDRP